jgi:hypothetical protein
MANLSFLLHHKKTFINVGQSNFFCLEVPPRQNSFDRLKIVEVDGLEDQSVDERRVDDVKVASEEDKVKFEKIE